MWSCGDCLNRWLTASCALVSGHVHPVWRFLDLTSLLKLSRAVWRLPGGFMWQLQTVFEHSEGLWVQLQWVRPRYWLLLTNPSSVWVLIWRHEAWETLLTSAVCLPLAVKHRTVMLLTVGSTAPQRLNSEQRRIWTHIRFIILHLLHHTLSDASREEAGSQTHLKSDYTCFLFEEQPFCVNKNLPTEHLSCD